MLGLIIGWIRRRIANARLRRLQRSIARQNAVNKNVIEYFDAPVEAYVSKTVTENIVVSGNNKDIRDRVCCVCSAKLQKYGIRFTFILRIYFTFCGSDRMSHDVKIAEIS